MRAQAWLAYDVSVRQMWVMIKYLLLIIMALFVGCCIWGVSWTIPQQIDFADRYYWSGTQDEVLTTSGIAYGQDPRQTLDIYRPAEKTAAPKPVLLFVHGGWWREGDRASYGFVGRAFAAQGFVTIVIDYRKIEQVRFPDFVNDAADAMAWAHENAGKYGGDPGQLFAMGHSAGAHLVMLAILDSQYLERRGLGSTDIRGAIGLAGPYDFSPQLNADTVYAFGQWQRPKQVLPITFARGDAPPLLLLTGAADAIVLPDNSKALAQAIKDVDGRASLKIYPKIDHVDIVKAIAGPYRGTAPVIADVASFIADNRIAQ
jgi:acetyl esterase/lipase